MCLQLFLALLSSFFVFFGVFYVFIAGLALLNSLFVYLCFFVFPAVLICWTVRLFFYFCFFIFVFIVSLPEHGGEHEGEHDDWQAKGEHEGQEDPVVRRRGVEDDEVDQDAGDH